MRIRIEYALLMRLFAFAFLWQMLTTPREMAEDLPLLISCALLTELVWQWVRHE